MTVNNIQFLSANFLLKRFHSLTGIMPLGWFLLGVIYTNSYALFGAQAYNERIAQFNQSVFFNIFLIVFICIPFAFHALYGVFLFFQTKHNVLHYGNADNWRFFFMRVSGLLGLIFIGYHFYLLHYSLDLKDQPMSFELMKTILTRPYLIWAYGIGSLVLIFHFCNGLWSFLIGWGVTVSEFSRKFSLGICSVLFLILSVVTVLSLRSFIL